MMKTMNTGIDYGLGRTNIDKASGIRYGVISQNEVLQAWSDSSEAHFGEPHCPKCGNQADKPEEFGETFQDGRPDDYTHERHECDDYVCVKCKHFFGSESAFGDDPLGFFLDDGEFKAECGQDGDIFVMLSPFYTHAQFCSPCAPGACYLTNPCEQGERAYCFGHDWFDDGKAPYPVYVVATGELVEPKA